MATTVLQPGLIQIVPYYTPNNDTLRNVANVTWWQSRLAGPISLVQLQNIQGVFEASWATMCTSYLASGKQFLGSVITDFSSATGLSHDSRPSIYEVTGSAGTPAPAQVSALISLPDGLRYRGGHGRVYLPWVGVNVLDSADTDHLGGGAISGILNHFQTLMANMVGSGQNGGQDLVVYHHRTDPAKAQTLDVKVPVVNALLATQRRRLRKIPRHKKKVIIA